MRPHHREAWRERALEAVLVQRGVRVHGVAAQKGAAVKAQAAVQRDLGGDGVLEEAIEGDRHAVAVLVEQALTADVAVLQAVVVAVPAEQPGGQREAVRDGAAHASLEEDRRPEVGLGEGVFALGVEAVVVRVVPGEAQEDTGGSGRPSRACP